MIEEIPPLTQENIEARAAWAREHTATQWIPQQTLREDRADGTIILRSPLPMDPVVTNTGQWLHEWAQKAPDRVALSERVDPLAASGPWRDVTYRELLAHVRAVASGLLAQGMAAGDKIAILSGNSIDHLILSLAAQYIGAPVTPLAEQYALIEEAQGRLIFVLDKIKPKLAFVDDAGRYASALKLPALDDVMVVASRTEGAP
ncbi:MAG TPA: AMP-binding protein, partial [Thiolinea sp.]|nr:AMP-binding protein [Thiolinea sp.]